MIPSISTKQNCFFLTKHHWSRVFCKKSETYLVEFLRSPYSECEESGILRWGGGGESSANLILLEERIEQHHVAASGATDLHYFVHCGQIFQCWAVLSSAELKASRFVKTKCLLNLKKDNL